MQYQSIIRLLEYCNIDSQTPDVGKMKKILSAEFAVAENGILSIDGFDYTKNDILQELDRPDFLERLEYHRLIWETSNLLDCLEKNTVNLHDTYSWKTLAQNPAFVHFISPYYAESFDKIMRKFLNPVSFRLAACWLLEMDFMDNAEDEYMAMRGVRSYLSDFTHTLKNVNAATYVMILPELENWTDQLCGLFVNRLPDSLYKLKDELTRAFVNFTVLIQREDQNLCYEISHFLAGFSGIDPELEKLIKSNHKIYSSKVESSSDSSGCSRIWLGFIPLIIFIVNMISTPSGSSPDDSLNNYSYDLQEKQVSAEYYENLRSKYNVIDAGGLMGDMNKNLVVISNSPYYFMFERGDTAQKVTLNIINEGTLPLTFYLKPTSSLPFDFVVAPKGSVQISRNRSTLDLLLSCTGESVLTNAPIPIFVSDSINFFTHTFRLKSEEGTIYLDKYTSPSQPGEITMKISLRSEKGFTLNVISFLDADWIKYEDVEKLDGN